MGNVSYSSLCFIKALLQAIDVLKREVQRQRVEKDALEANVREQVVSEMMEVISRMEDGFRCAANLFTSYLFFGLFVSWHTVPDKRNDIVCL